MTSRLIVWLVMTLSVGYVCLRLLLPRARTSYLNFFTEVCLAFGLGIGVSSCVFFVCLLVSSNGSSWLFFTEGAILSAGSLFLLGFSKSFNRRSSRSYEPATNVESLPQLRFFAPLVYATTAFSLAVFLMYSFDARHGEYDGWEIWNMRARFLFRGGSHWADGFTNLLDYSHPDYPLLIPASIARSWFYGGVETQITAITIALAFTFGTIALLTFSLWQLRSKSQGLLAGLALVGTPFFIIHGASQYADVPLGFYYLATLVVLNLHEQVQSGPKPLVLAGITAGLSAWTKNEGVLFVGCIVLALVALSVASKGWKHCLDRLAPFCLGLFPILAVVAYFKITLAPPNDIVSGQGLAATLERLLTLSRYWDIGKAFVEQLFSFGVWHPYTNIPLLLGFYFLLLGVDFSQWSIGVGVCVAALVLMVMAYFMTYLVTPRPLQWHLMTSLNRLCLQLWPSFLFTYFLIVRTPERAMASDTKVKPQELGAYRQRGIESLAVADQARL